MVGNIAKKKRLTLTESSTEGIRVGVMKDGRNYSVRDDRRRYFFPDEWENFMDTIKNKTHRLFFLTCLHSGARIMEVLNLKYKDIDLDRSTITFQVVKYRAAKKTIHASGKSRTFFISDNFIKEFKSFIRTKTINKESYIFLDNAKLPKNYDSLTNKEKQKFFRPKVSSYSQILKRKLKKAGIKDYYNFSPHNIRKTYGMWMRAYNKEIAEICYRLGHDINTYLAHYGSSLIFTEDERRKILKIVGEVK